MWAEKKKALYQRVERIFKKDVPEYIAPVHVEDALEDLQTQFLDLHDRAIVDEDVVFIAKALKKTHKQITRVDLSFNRITNVGTRALARALKYTRITHLDLSTNQIYFEGIKAISKVLKDTQITHLCLAGNRVGEEGALLIANALKHTRITSLDLRNTAMGISGVPRIAFVLAESKLTSLNLKENYTGILATIAIVHVVKNRKMGPFNLIIDLPKELTNWKLITLDLTVKDTYITALKFEGNSPMPRFHEWTKYSWIINADRDTTRITFLELKGMYMEMDQVQALANALKHSQLTSLYLLENKLGDDKIIMIANGVKGSNITKLDFSENMINVEGAIAVMDALKGTRVTWLNLQGNWITGERVKSMAVALEHTIITNLSLARNKIEDEGVADLAISLKRTLITHLNLDENDIKSFGASIIADVLKDTKIIHLSLKGNDIGTEGLLALANVWKETRIISLAVSLFGIIWETGVTVADSLKDTQITHIEVHDDLYYIYDELLEPVLKSNQLKISQQFNNHVSKENDVCTFKIMNDHSNPLQYLDFTCLVSEDKQKYLELIMANDYLNYTKHELEGFIENIQTHLADFLIKLNNTLIDNVKLLLSCEERGLSGVVDRLLIHRPWYLMIGSNYRNSPVNHILHPAVYILMNAYGQPWYFQNMRPTREDLIQIFQTSKFDNLIKEEELSQFDGGYTKEALLKILFQAGNASDGEFQR